MLIKMAERMDGRNGLIWKMYCDGWNQDAIAEKFNITQGRVSQVISQVRAQIPAEDLSERRQRQLDTLDKMHKKLTELIEMPLPPAYSNGRPILDEDGRMVRDASGQLSAMRELRAFTERASKLLGLDASTKVDVVVNEAARQKSAEAAAAALARMAEDEGEQG